MESPDTAIDQLVERVRGRLSHAAEAEEVRRAFAVVLKELGVQPGDPAWTDGRDVIGRAYEQLLSGQTRRPLGQFFTPLSIGRAMSSWLLAGAPRLLLDPACGSGSLLVAAAQERCDMTPLLGFDIDPLAIEMASANAALRRIETLQLRRQNFLTDATDMRPDAVICNPPFTRHQQLTRNEKLEIHEGFKSRLGLELSQLASLHVLFLLRALEVSAEGARLAFITPAHWLDMNYSRAVKEFVLARAHVEAIIQFPAGQLVFDDAVTTAAITLIRKTDDPRQAGHTRFAQAASIDRQEILRAFADHTRSLSLSSGGKWSRIERRRRPAKALRLEQVARVHRGAATGHNEFFVVSDEGRRFHELNRCYLRPCAASTRWFDGDEITHDTLASLPDTAPRWLLHPSRSRLGGPLERYLLRARPMGVHERHLVKLRVKAGRPWWEVEADFDAPILFTYLNRRRPRFIRNRAGAIPLNNWLVIEPLDGVDVEKLFSVLQDATGAALREEAREYGNGLWKLEPSELRRLVLHGF